MNHLENLLQECSNDIEKYYITLSTDEKPDKNLLLGSLYKINEIKKEISTMRKPYKPRQYKKPVVFQPVKNKHNVLKTAYYIAKFGYEDLFNDVKNTAQASKKIAPILDIKLGTYSLYISKMKGLLGTKYTFFNEYRVEKTLLEVKELCDNMAKANLLKEVKAILFKEKVNK